MKEKRFIQDIFITIQVIDPEGVEGTRPPYDPVNGISFLKQQFGQVTAVLSGDPGY